MDVAAATKRRSAHGSGRSNLRKRSRSRTVRSASARVTTVPAPAPRQPPSVAAQSLAPSQLPSTMPTTIHESATARPTVGSTSVTTLFAAAGAIEHEKYYHGLMPREDMELLLVKDGDFVVRLTDLGGRKRIVLSVMWQQPRHVLLKRSRQGMWYLTKQSFDSVPDLVSWYRKEKEKLTKDGAMLLHAVPRQEWELHHSQVARTVKLGEGAFGEVYRGTLNVNKRQVLVAIKTLRNVGSTKEERLTFVREARLMRSLRHRHIVSIIGVAAQEEPLMIIMELMPGGSLLSRLRSHGLRINVTGHVRFCSDALKGLRYLELHNCIHRDIAARNCLLDKRQRVKISDFGLTLQTQFHKETESKSVPIKWLSPETLNEAVYTHKSDVWSFGVLLWEVFSDGAEPYAGLTNAETRRAIVLNHLRLEPCFGTPAKIRQVMVSCWQQEADHRPTFVQLHKTFAAISKNPY